MITISDLLQPLTDQQILSKWLDQLESVGLPAKSWRAGGSLRTILAILAKAYAAFVTSMLGFVQAGFLETSTGGWLTLLAYYVYGVTRIVATSATGQVQLTNGGGGLYNIPAGAFQVAHATTGKVYQNQSSFTLNPGDVLLIDVQAIELGSASNATPGTVTKLVTALAGVTATNLTSIVGNDAEKDPDLRQRCKDKLGIIGGKGVRGAYRYAITSALRTDGTPVDINRSSVSPQSSTGIVTIYVASAAGAPTMSDLPFISASIEALARVDTDTVSLNAATAMPFANALTVWARRTDGIDASAIAALVVASLLDFLTTYPIGGIPKPPSSTGYLWASALEGAAKAAHASIYAVDGVGSDVLMTVGQVATLGATVSVNIVDV